MPFQQVRPEDRASVERMTEINNAAGAVDDPEEPPDLPELASLSLAYGWDLEPSASFLYTPLGGSDPLGVLTLTVPQRDNRHALMAGCVVHPRHRREGHGSVMAGELFRRASELGRSTIWSGCAADDEAGAAFLKRHGFSCASHEARRYQHLNQLDHATIDQHGARAREAAGEYDLVRLCVPTDEAVLTELIEVTAAINDAPMGDLDYENETFDLTRLQDFEFASRAKGERLYRVFARHRPTGAVGGHTVLGVQPRRPGWGVQMDTAVHRDHRGHRLGLLLKIDMMHWLATAEPQLEIIETWNHADNGYMINVNEAIGYRLSRVFDEYQRVLS